MCFSIPLDLWNDHYSLDVSGKFFERSDWKSWKRTRAQCQYITFPVRPSLTIEYKTGSCWRRLNKPGEKVFPAALATRNNRIWLVKRCLAALSTIARIGCARVLVRPQHLSFARFTSQIYNENTQNAAYRWGSVSLWDPLNLLVSPQSEIKISPAHHITVPKALSKSTKLPREGT